MFSALSVKEAKYCTFLEIDLQLQGSTNCVCGDERAHNMHPKRLSGSQNYVRVNQSKHL